MQKTVQPPHTCHLLLQVVGAQLYQLGQGLHSHVLHAHVLFATQAHPAQLLLSG